MVESFAMKETLRISPQDKSLASLPFKPYRSMHERRVIPFLPAPNEPQTLEIDTPWGTHLTARKGDFLISEVEAPDDYWAIDPVIFEESYVMVRPGYCVKKAVILLVPLTKVTRDPNRTVTVETLEGDVTVRAGDFYLAKGIKGEIWPYPREKVEEMLVRVE